MKATSKEGMWKIHSVWEQNNSMDGESKKQRKDISIWTKVKEVEISINTSIIMGNYGMLLYNQRKVGNMHHCKNISMCMCLQWWQSRSCLIT